MGRVYRTAVVGSVKGTVPWASVCARALLVATLVGGCGPGDSTLLEVRTTFPPELRERLEESFETARPDVDVRMLVDDPDATLQALRSGESPDFDVWLGVPDLTLERAAKEGLLRAFAPDWGEGGPAAWHPVLTTPLVIAFQRSVIPLAEAPLEWTDVLHHGWFEEIGALDPRASAAGGAFVASMLVEALRDDGDLNRGFDWLSRFHDQVAVYEADAPMLLRRLEREELLLAVVPRADVEVARADGETSLHYRIPASGTPEVIRGVAIAADSGASDIAQAFVDRLGSTEIVLALARHTRWDPATGSPDPSSLPDPVAGRWTAYAPAVDTLAREWDGWLERWEREIRTR